MTQRSVMFLLAACNAVGMSALLAFLPGDATWLAGMLVVMGPGVAYLTGCWVAKL